VPVARVVDEDLADDPGGERVEVRAAGPGHLLLPLEAQIGIVDDRRRLERLVPPAAPQVRGGDPPQVVVDERHQPLGRRPVAGAPPLQEVGDAFHAIKP
jgi:hypothetical protein